MRGILFRETVLSYLSGIVFAAGWWIWIDACVYSSVIDDPVRVLPQFYIPGIVSSVALLMINALSWSQINGVDDGFFGDGQSKKARIWFLFSFAVAFGAVFASVWIGIQIWLAAPDTDKPKTTWPGVAIMLQNILIFTAACIYRFAKPQLDEFGEPLISH